MSAFDDYMRRTDREVFPGTIESYTAMRNAANKPVIGSQAPVALGADNFSWFSQNWKWLALGGLALIALASM
jgi:hypothetical protein